MEARYQLRQCPVRLIPRDREPILAGPTVAPKPGRQPLLTRLLVGHDRFGQRAGIPFHDAPARTESEVTLLESGPRAVAQSPERFPRLPREPEEGEGAG